MPLIIRELLCGSVRFNDLQRGVPRISSALLAQRLKQLQFSGIIERRQGDGGGMEYHLTTAGQELFPVIEKMGLWAQRWLRHDLIDTANLDPNLLMWTFAATSLTMLRSGIGGLWSSSSSPACRSAGAVTGWFSSAASSICVIAIPDSMSISSSRSIYACSRKSGSATFRSRMLSGTGGFVSTGRVARWRRFLLGSRSACLPRRARSRSGKRTSGQLRREYPVVALVCSWHVSEVPIAARDDGSGFDSGLCPVQRSVQALIKLRFTHDASTS